MVKLHITTYTAASMTPKLSGNSLVAISGIIFAYTGAEISATYVTEIENPKKNFPKAIILQAVIISVLLAAVALLPGVDTIYPVPILRLHRSSYLTVSAWKYVHSFLLLYSCGYLLQMHLLSVL